MGNKNGKKYNEIEPVKADKVETVIETEVVEKKTMEKIITVQPKKVKRNLIGRLFNGVAGPDGVSGIGEYVNEEIIKPAIKNIIVDAVTSGINMIMYGERGGAPRNYRRDNGYRTTNTQRTNYASRYESSSSRSTEHTPRQATRNRRVAEEYLIPDRYDASNVLATLTEAADQYGSVSVADYYELIGVPSVYTDNDYGWTYDAIVRATIVPVRGGFVLKFPPMEVI